MDDLANLVTVVGDRFKNNIGKSFANMTPEKWIRIVIVVGGYMLLRPYLIKLGGKVQMAQHEKEEAESKARAQISPNQLRGRVEIPDDTDDEEEEGTSTGPDWGKAARRRQRDMIKKLLDAEEKRLQESLDEKEDKDIEEFLIKE